MKTAIVPGSFDPITRGHCDLVRRASTLFDKVIVLCLINPDKSYVFSPEERVALAQYDLAPLNNVTVDFFDGYLWQYYEKCGACAVVKGVRSAEDYFYEREMAHINASLLPGFETLLLPASDGYETISSKAAKAALESGDAAKFVSENTLKALKLKGNRNGC